MATPPIPFILCGRNPNIAKAVREGMAPEYHGESLLSFLSLPHQTTELEKAIPTTTTPSSQTATLIPTIPHAYTLQNNLNPLTHIVLHTFLSLEEAKTNIPPILSSSSPDRPVAVVLGGGFDDAMFAEIKEACDAAQGEKEVAWLRTDITGKVEMPDMNDTEAYGKAMGARLKRGLKELGAGREEGVKEVKGGVHFF